jgi:quercetin dioxygenase-like cupin family protein
MKIFKLGDMHRGWFIGDFQPSVFRTKDFEVGVLTHKKGEYWAEHYHKIATEINVLLEGSMSVNGIHISVGDVFVFEPNESSAPMFHEDCKVLCVKTPSVIGDKYETVRE